MRKHGVSVFGQARVSARGGGGGAETTCKAVSNSHTRPAFSSSSETETANLQLVPKGAGGGGGLGWVGLGWVKASPGRLPTVRAAFPAGPDWAAVPGCPVTRPTGLLTAPRPPRWRSRAGDAAVPVCMCPCVSEWGGGGGGCGTPACFVVVRRWCTWRGEVCAWCSGGGGVSNSFLLHPPVQSSAPSGIMATPRSVTFCPGSSFASCPSLPRLSTTQGRNTTMYGDDAMGSSPPAPAQPGRCKNTD